jgi:hypothetical protein
MKEFIVHFHTKNNSVVTVKAETADEAARKVIDWDLSSDEWDTIDDDPMAQPRVVIEEVLENK